MKHIFCFLFAMNFLMAAAQTRMELAEEAFDNRQYTLALDYYNKILEKQPKRDLENILFRIAECYRYTGKSDKALEFYDKAIKAGYAEPNAVFLQANVLMQEGKYAEAEKKLNAFLEQMPNDKDALRMLNQSKFAQNAQEQPSIYTVQNVSSINSEFSDYGAVWVKNKLVFTSSRMGQKESDVYAYDGQGFSNLYETTYNNKDKSWSKPALITTLSSKFNDGGFTFCEANKTAYFTQCTGSGKGESCTIVESKYDDINNTWSTPKAIITPIHSKIDIAQPAIDSKGETLFFVSKLDNGLGGTDIWTMKKRGLGWEDPVNLTAINTEFDEMFPTLYNDTVLYFASEGHSGYGGLDIFYSVKKDGQWGKPVNMRAPFNSSGDDFFMVFNADRSEGYFTSNRTGGVGSDDIYYCFITPIKLTVKGRVTDVDENSPLVGAKVVLSTEDGESYSTTTNAKGEYEFQLDKNKKYKINVSNPGYFGDSKKLSTEGEMYSKEFSKATGNNYDFVIKRIPKEEIRIDNIYYDYNSYTLREESKPNLDKLVKLLEDTPDAIIQIYSHTDERGQPKYNLELSDNRAKSVVEYLVEKGINPARLSYKGFGFQQPVVKNAKTEDEHQLNRRTTFKVVN